MRDLPVRPRFPRRGMKVFALGMIATVVSITAIANAGLGGLFGFVNSIPGADLTLHFGLYALLSLGVVSWLSERLTTWRARGLLVAGLAILIALEEWSQSLFASRSVSLTDLYFSLAGLLAGALASVVWVSHTVD